MAEQDRVVQAVAVVKALALPFAERERFVVGEGNDVFASVREGGLARVRGRLVVARSTPQADCDGRGGEVRSERWHRPNLTVSSDAVRELAATGVCVVFALACGSSNAPSPPRDDGTPAPSSPCGEAVPSCPADQCAGGRCTLLRLAEANGEVFAVDDTHVYWANAHEIHRIPKCGGPVEVVALSQADFTEVRAHGDALYLRLDASPQKLYRLPKTLGAIEEREVDPSVTVGPTVGLAVAGDQAYVAHQLGIIAFPLAGGPGVVLRQSGVASTLGSDDERAYFYASYPDPGFLALEGLTESAFFKPETTSSLLVSASASDGDALYVAYGMYKPVMLYRVGPAVGETPLAELDERPTTVRVDDRCVYVASEEGKTRGLRRVPKTGGTLEMLAAAGGSFALDADAIYFTSAANLYRLPK